MKRLASIAVLIAGSAAADPAITLTPDTDLVWETTPEGVAFAALSGDRWTEAYFAYVRLPAGTVSPLHWKSATMYGLVVEGEMTHARPGAETRPIGPGAYYEVPAGLPHVSSCVSDTACVTLLYQDGAFDFVPVAQ